MEGNYKVREVNSMDVVKKVEKVRKISIILSLIPLIGLVCLKGVLWKALAAGLLLLLLAGSIYLMNREIQKATLKEVTLRFLSGGLAMTVKKKNENPTWTQEDILMNRENFLNLRIQSENKRVMLYYRENGNEKCEDFSVKGLRDPDKCLQELKNFAERTLTEQGYKRK